MESRIFTNHLLRIRRGGALCGAGLLLAILLALPGSSEARRAPAHPHASSARSAPSRSEPRAVALLRRTLRRGGKHPFTGQQTVITFDRGDGTAVVTQEMHLGHHHSQILFENPPDARGRIAISDGKRRRIYLPSTKTIVENPVNVFPMNDTTANELLARIQTWYILRLHPKLDDVDGREAYRLDLLARRHDRPWQKLWIDKETGMILRRETYGTDGAQRSVSSWRNLHFLKPNEVCVSGWKLPPRARISRSASYREVYRVEEARKMVGSWATVPQSLGQGFIFESAHTIKAMGSPGIYCEYSDGLTAISLVEVEGQQGLYMAPHEGKVLGQTYIGSHHIEVIQDKSFLVLTWTENSCRRTINLIAEISESTMLVIAKSLP